MFNPISAQDRINYGKALLPPTGYKLNCAVGTTYSLDLETLTAVSISLGLIEDTDSELIGNPICMLNALQKISEKITLFCEAGQIKLPTKTNALSLMLEKMVVPVALPYNDSKRRYPSFHPKTWLLEYENDDGEKQYRFVIMSRNLTFDHSWDIACFMDGVKTDEPVKETKPLIDFLMFLKTQLNEASSSFSRHCESVDHMMGVLSDVYFESDDRFTDYDIYPLGIGKRSYKISKDDLFVKGFHALVVMSPFLSGSVISDLNQDKKSLSGNKRTLITRRSELSKIGGNKSDNFDVYVMKDCIVDGESSLSDGESNDSDVHYPKQDIHAKVYVRRVNNDVSLYIGSMNASLAAINSNVEMVLCLRTKKRLYDENRFLDEIMGVEKADKSNPFELIDPNDKAPETDDSKQDEAEQLIKSICRIKMVASVETTDESRYDLIVNADITETDNNVMIRPLSSNKSSILMPQMTFESLSELQLSEFYVVTATVEECTLERVIMIPTVGLPIGREAEIVRSVIKDRKSFIEYIAFILGDDYVQTFLENQRISRESASWDIRNALPAIYEKMLKTSVSNPDRLKDIQYITQLVIDEDIIPVEFREMYQVFCKTLGIE